MNCCESSLIGESSQCDPLNITNKIKNDKKFDARGKKRMRAGNY
jgi:hypothetical protein